VGYLPNPQHAQITEVTIQDPLLKVFIAATASKAYLDSDYISHRIVPRYMLTQAYELLLGSVLVNTWLHDCWNHDPQLCDGPSSFPKSITKTKKAIERVLISNPDVTIFYCKIPF